MFPMGLVGENGVRHALDGRSAWLGRIPARKEEAESPVCQDLVFVEYKVMKTNVYVNAAMGGGRGDIGTEGGGRWQVNKKQNCPQNV